MKQIRLLLLLLVSTTIVHAQQTKLKNAHVLIYTKNGKGYIHDNISSAVASIQSLGVQENFKVDVSDQATVFTEQNLAKYTMLIFPSTNNDVFDNDEQRLAFRRYMEAGGGMVGLHSVTGTERNWTWFKMLIGCTFSWHAKFQKFTVRKLSSDHPSMKDVPLIWEREDECYFGKELYPVTQVLMAHKTSTLNHDQKDILAKNLGTYADYYPAVWYNNFQGGHVWVTTLGHSKESYNEPVYKNHLLQGIKFIASQYKGINYSNAYATHRDDEIKK